MKNIRAAMAAVVILTAAVPARAELIWGELEHINNQQNLVVIKAYDAMSGSMEHISVRIPAASDLERIVSLNDLKVGDDILVDAKPGTRDSYVAEFVNIPAEGNQPSGA